VAIEFIGFAADWRITGQIPLADDRLSDMLNSVVRVVVRGATVEDLDTAEIETGDVTVACGDLVVVVGTGRRGLENLRKRTVTRRIEVDLGRFVVAGDLHVPVPADQALMAGDPRDLLAGRDLLVPLTGATIHYERGGRQVVETHETLIINRARATHVQDGDTGAQTLVGTPSTTVAARWRTPRHVGSRTD
jgi:hypothetical protein